MAPCSDRFALKSSQAIEKTMENQIPEKFPSKLQARTLELYDQSSRHITNKKISEATGLTEAWLSDFLNGKIKKPPAGKLEALYNYLSASPFEI